MNTLHKIMGLCVVTISLLAIEASAAFAAPGVIRIECAGNCNNVSLAQACNTFSTGSKPRAIACDDTTTGSGTNFACGTSGQTCRQFGLLSTSDKVGDYCADGASWDAMVMCDTM
jgi:hypothetical protein